MILPCLVGGYLVVGLVAAGILAFVITQERGADWYPLDGIMTLTAFLAWPAVLVAVWRAYRRGEV